MILEKTDILISRIRNHSSLPKRLKIILDLSANKRKGAGIKLFMIISAIMGTAFISAGLFSIITHNFDSHGVIIKLIISFIPVIAGLLLYFITITKHSGSIVWKEASGLFLFFMIGATIASVAQTYHMDGDFKKCAILWLILATPILYITKSSSVFPFYLGLAATFLIPNITWGFLTPTDFNTNTDFYIFWIFLLAAIPHFILTFNHSKKQGVRTIFLSYFLAISIPILLPFIFPGGLIYWYLILISGSYFLSRKYYNDNSLLQRPFDLITYFILGFGLIVLSAAPSFIGSSYLFLKTEPIWKIENYSGSKLIFNILGIIAFIGLVLLSIKQLKRGIASSKHILALPFIVLFQLILLNLEHYIDFDMLWIGDWIFYLFVIGFAVQCMSDGGRRARYPKLIYGLVLIFYFLWCRYFDTEMGFILKGIVFMVAGGFFFLLDFIAKEDLDRIEAETIHLENSPIHGE